MAFNYYCIDAGSQYCPCYLAKTDNCLICSILQGKEYCDCKWQGICVYQEYIWANGKIEERKSLCVTIAEKKYINDRLFTLTIEIPSDSLIRAYNQPGAFAFLRPANFLEYYDVPLCVMDVDESKKHLTFAINIIGPKSKALAISENAILIRGPYWNGLFGLKHIKSSYNKNWIVIGRGIGQASLLPVVKNLLRGNNRITVLLDPGNLKVNLVEKEINKLGIEFQVFDLNSSFHKIRLKEIIEKSETDFIYSCGSDAQHKFIQNVLNKVGYKIPLVISNNYQLCCGEGICGSCESMIDGELIHLCKIQLGSEQVLGG
ncbi:MAG: sulfide/dihydroorotate dehydrogenase-like FAD/NAD-binding protein [Tepidanaerobacteraceae bacterium]|nr:sulfide/dihydroorotate dehydrogenase-like FAD/NAD-binding protein [Tepidanaerobacteraceae bacterium]